MTNENIQLETKVSIAFPKSSEDHRLQLVEINGAIFGLLHSPLESQGPIRLFCDEWSLILLAPIKSKTHVVISAANLICLSEIASEEGNINLHASSQLVNFTHPAQSSGVVCQMGEKGEFLFPDDLGSLVYYYRVFDQMIPLIRSTTPSSFSDAQQMFIAILCTLANKIKGNPGNLALHQVLDVWGIPHMNSEDALT